MNESNNVENSSTQKKPISLWIAQVTFSVFVLRSLNSILLVNSDNLIAELARPYILAKIFLVLIFVVFSAVSIISIISIERRKKYARRISFVTMLISIPLAVLMTLMSAGDSHSLAVRGGGEQFGAALFNDIMLLIPVVLMLLLLLSKKIKHYLS